MSKGHRKERSNPLIKTSLNSAMSEENLEDRPSSPSKSYSSGIFRCLFFIGNNEAYDVPLESNSGTSTEQEAELFGESNSEVNEDKLVAVIDSERVGDKDPYVSYTIRIRVILQLPHYYSSCFFSREARAKEKDTGSLKGDFKTLSVFIKPIRNKSPHRSLSRRCPPKTTLVSVHRPLHLSVTPIGRT